MGLICKRLLSHQGRRQQQQQQQQESSSDIKSKDTNPSSSSSSSPTTFAMPRFLPSLASKKSTSTSSSYSTGAVPSLQSINTTSTTYYEDNQLTPIEMNNESPYNTVATPTVPFGWEVRFDPTLGEYYYLNQINNLIQLDHPEEVLSPITRHVSLDSIFNTTKEDESDSNFKLSKYGDDKVTNVYTDMALNHHYLLANGTGIPQQQLKKSWKERLSLIKTRSMSRPSSPTLQQQQQIPKQQQQPQQQQQQQQQQQVLQQRKPTIPREVLDNNDTSSLISVSSSEASINDRTAENFFYGMSQQQSEQIADDDEEEEEETYDQNQLELIRMRMLMEVKSCEMQKLATV